MNSQDPQAAQVASPCIGVCQLDASSVCLGCGRRIEEIVEWPRASESRRRQIVQHAAERRTQPPEARP